MFFLKSRYVRAINQNNNELREDWADYIASCSVLLIMILCNEVGYFIIIIQKKKKKQTHDCNLSLIIRLAKIFPLKWEKVMKITGLLC